LGIAGLLPVAGLLGVTGLLLPVTRLLLPVAGLLGAAGLLGRVTGRVVGIGLLGHGEYSPRGLTERSRSRSALRRWRAAWVPGHYRNARWTGSSSIPARRRPGWRAATRARRGPRASTTGLVRSRARRPARAGRASRTATRRRRDGP